MKDEVRKKIIDEFVGLKAKIILWLWQIIEKSKTAKRQ